MMSVREEKEALRTRILGLRDAMTPEERRNKSERIAEKIIASEEFRKAKSVLVFASFRSEVETDKIAEAALKLGKRLHYPKVIPPDCRIGIYEVSSPKDLSPGYMGIPEPNANTATLRLVSDIDLVIIPGAAFDRNGGRLGYGKGCYDKLLKSAPEGITVIAPAFAMQAVDSVPSEGHDIRVDAVITEEAVIWTSRKSRKA